MILPPALEPPIQGPPVILAIVGNGALLFLVAWGGDRRGMSALNLFYSPVKNIDLGVEYRHAKRTLGDGQSGRLDRGALAARHSF